MTHYPEAASAWHHDIDTRRNPFTALRVLSAEEVREADRQKKPVGIVQNVKQRTVSCFPIKYNDEGLKKVQEQARIWIDEAFSTCLSGLFDGPIPIGPTGPVGPPGQVGPTNQPATAFTFHTASGKDLDTWGDFYCVTRHPLEPDAEYRERIMAHGQEINKRPNQVIHAYGTVSIQHSRAKDA